MREEVVAAKPKVRGAVGPRAPKTLARLGLPDTGHLQVTSSGGGPTGSPLPGLSPGKDP